MDHNVLLTRIKEIEAKFMGILGCSTYQISKCANKIPLIISSETGNSIIFKLGENQTELISKINDLEGYVRSVELTKYDIQSLIRDIEKLKKDGI